MEDQGFYDFGNTDDFLESISGAISSLSPSSLSGDEFLTTSIDPNSINYELNEDYTNPKFSNDQEFFPEVYEGDNIPQGPVDFSANNDAIIKSESISSSYSNDSYSNDTPSTRASSTNTSPEMVNIKNEYIPHIPTVSEQNAASSETSSNGSLSGAKPLVEKGKKKASKVTKPAKKDKTSHNMIEKKYRTNINSKILILRDAVPSLRIAAAGPNAKISMVDLEGLVPASKLNKASVLTKATEYIKHLEQKNDVLRRQNIQLQRLIQDASMHPQPPQQTPQQIFNQQQMPQPHGFGYTPSEQSFNTTPVLQSYSNNFVYNSQANLANANPEYNNEFNNPPNPQNSNFNSNSRFLLAGMAGIMGTSLISDDFQGLSAVPMFQIFKFNPSPLTVQLFNLIKIGLFIISLATLIYPYLEKMINKSEKETIKTERNVYVSWLLITLGIQLPHTVTEDKMKEIQGNLLGRNKFSWMTLLENYVFLSSSEIVFENVLLNLIIGNLLTKKYSFLTKIFGYNLNLKTSLIVQLNYDGTNNSLIKVNKLIKNLRDVSLFESTSLSERLLNLSMNLPINSNVNDGQNYMRYVEAIQLNPNNYYEILFNWRILEIIHHLNISYLKTLLAEDDTKEKKTTQIKKDLQSLGDVLNSESKSSATEYFKLFNSIVNSSNGSIELLELVKNKVNDNLSVFKVLMEGQDVTDGDISDDEEADEVEYPSININTPSKSLITSLNLVNEEQFVVLVCSLISYYKEKKEVNKASILLKHLSFANSSADEISTSLTLLSFTAIIKIVDDLINANEEIDEPNEEILDKLIRSIRIWINDNDKDFFLNKSFRGDLSDLIISKAMILSGDVNHSD